MISGDIYIITTTTIKGNYRCEWDDKVIRAKVY